MIGTGSYWRARTHRRSRWSQQDSCCVGLLVLRVTSTCVYVAVVGFLLFLGFYLLDSPDTTPADSDSVVTLLVWTHPFGRYRKLPDCLKLYHIDGCALTDDERAYPRADAVLIHHRDLVTGAADLPPEPRPNAQKWIWMNYESPAHTTELWRFEDVFNLTMTYRTDSDVFLPYGYLVPRGGLSRTQRNPPRPHLLAWVVSNWSESHTRVVFYHELRRYIPVDVFGRAGQPIPEDSGTGVQVRKLLRRYQFYLSLENSQHTDYITEKLWNALQAGSVPVVLGPSRQNYERFLPPEAFIHVDDFSTVRGLARYLLMLRRNPVRFRRHLDWRRRYRVHQTSFWTEHYCTACRAVRRTRGRTDVVQDLTRWFHS
ncbi:alpha-(1,3)-fucosyltransferase 4-like [Sebastes fasciatus]|uniref:alpha-(1,3)-fucosyltransferase 4-like n=1 Tax=Sebastes fasciatus TaxID=394691 RepID=UPI003D9F632F